MKTHPENPAGVTRRQAAVAVAAAAAFPSSILASEPTRLTEAERIFRELCAAWRDYQAEREVTEPMEDALQAAGDLFAKVQIGIHLESDKPIFTHSAEGVNDRYDQIAKAHTRLYGRNGIRCVEEERKRALAHLAEDEKRVQKIQDDTGYTAAVTRQQEALDRFYDGADKLMAAPVVNRADIAMKLRVALYAVDGIDDIATDIPAPGGLDWGPGLVATAIREIETSTTAFEGVA